MAATSSRLLPRICLLYRQIPGTRSINPVGTGHTHCHRLKDSSKLNQAPIHTSVSCFAGTKWREENNLPRSGNEYGPLTDRPDWSYADGRAGPPSKGALKRRQQQRDLAMKIDELANQIFAAKENYRRSIQSRTEEETERQRRQLKSKGEFISNLNPNRNKKRQRKQGGTAE